ncbi:GTPase-activating protein [Podochytrium sp. JEL0797]|nr:GTPase-activating protein [Podochytrium sp. JEL0797]
MQHKGGEHHPPASPSLSGHSIKNPQAVKGHSELSSSPGRPKSAESQMLGAVAELNMKSIRFKKFEALLEASVIDMEQLKKLSWMGVPEEIRHTVWKILMGYLPTNSQQRDKILAQKRTEYEDYVLQQFSEEGKSGLDPALVHQVHIDVLRTNSTIRLYQSEVIRESLERILYIWAIRHPASGYVQGINDLATPFYQVFLQSYVPDDVETTDVSHISKTTLAEVEADTYWCLTRLLDGIQDNYTHAQPGIQRQIARLKELINRIDAQLAAHFQKEGVEFIQFAFRWMNCLLMRELPLKSTIRMWDSYQAEGIEGLSEFHLYVCAAFLVKWSAELKKLEFPDIIQFLQSTPTASWGDRDIELLLSEAFMWKSLFGSSPQHLKNNNPNAEAAPSDTIVTNEGESSTATASQESFPSSSPSNPATTGSGNNGGNSGENTNGGGNTNSGNSGTNNSSAPCVPNQNAQPGGIYLIAPNGNSLATNYGVVGGNLNITWSYSLNAVTPATISIYWARSATNNGFDSSSAPTPKTFYENPAIALNIPGSPSHYIWKIDGLQPGDYELRIVGDGLDPQYYMQMNPGQVQCYKQGQPFPGKSLAPFVIAGNNQLVSYPEVWGPEGAGGNEHFIAAAMSLKHVRYAGEMTNDEKVRAFALIMQASEGPVSTSEDIHPQFFEIAAQAKLQAWRNLGDLSSVRAQAQLISFVAEMADKYRHSESVEKAAFRVDTHFHIIPDFYRDAVEAAGGDPSGFPKVTPTWTLEAAKERMSLLKILHGVMSVTAPGPALFPKDQSREMARSINEFSSKIVKDDPARFSFFASVPNLFDVEGVLAEIQHACDVLGAAGFVIFTSYASNDETRYLGHPSFEPIWEELNKRRAVVFTHPTHGPYAQVSDFLPMPFMDYTQETTRMAADLVTSGTTAKFPEISFILSHGGGTVPYLAQRICGTGLVPSLKTPLNYMQMMKEFRKFYYDVALSTSPAQLKALLEVADPGRILFGSDVFYAPIFSSQAAADGLDSFFEAHGGDGVEVLEKINRANAAKLFGRDF